MAARKKAGAGAARGVSEPAAPYTIDLSAPENVGDIVFGAMKFDRAGSPNGVRPHVMTDADELCLRLAVRNGAYTDATGGEPTARDRCELRDGKIELGTPVLYSFEMRVDEAFPLVDARFVCAQIKAPFFDNNASPVFALRIDRGRYFATVEHLYQPADAPAPHGTEVSRYVRRYAGGEVPKGYVRALDHHIFGNARGDDNELQVRALMATDGAPLPAHLEDELRDITKGVVVEPNVVDGMPVSLPATPREWHGFRIGMAANQRPEEAGVIQLFTFSPGGGGDVLVATAKGEFGHWPLPNEALGEKANRDARRQYFKIGPYRDKLRIWGDAEAAVFVRNISRAPWPEGAQIRATLPVI